MHTRNRPLRFHRGVASALAAGMIIALLAVGILAMVQVARWSAGGPVYTVAALRAHLARDPDAWVDRPLRVRAVAGICTVWTAWPGVGRAGPCMNWQPSLIDPHDDVEALPLASGPVPPLIAFLRRLPLPGYTAPAPQQPRWDALGVYRIQLHAFSCSSLLPPCYEALLLDAVPGLPRGD